LLDEAQQAEDVEDVLHTEEGFDRNCWRHVLDAVRAEEEGVGVEVPPGSALRVERLVGVLAVVHHFFGFARIFIL